MASQAKQDAKLASFNKGKQLLTNIEVGSPCHCEA